MKDMPKLPGDFKRHRTWRALQDYLAALCREDLSALRCTDPCQSPAAISRAQGRLGLIDLLTDEEALAAVLEPSEEDTQTL